VLKGHTGGVLSVHWNPSGKTLASGSVDKTIGIWDPAKAVALAVLKGHTNPPNRNQPILKSNHPT